MTEVTVSFTAEELLELSRQLHLVSYIMEHYDDYPNSKLANGIEQKLCALGHTHFNENNDYEFESRFGDFLVSTPHFEELETIAEASENRVIMEYLEDMLAYRDMQERHANVKDDDIANNIVLYKEYQEYRNIYKMELLLNGIKNLRLFKLPTN
jgi:hypothetical protein